MEGDSDVGSEGREQPLTTGAPLSTENTELESAGPSDVGPESSRLHSADSISSADHGRPVAEESDTSRMPDDPGDTFRADGIDEGVEGADEDEVEPAPALVTDLPTEVPAVPAKALKLQEVIDILGICLEDEPAAILESEVPATSRDAEPVPAPADEEGQEVANMAVVQDQQQQEAIMPEMPFLDQSTVSESVRASPSPTALAESVPSDSLPTSTPAALSPASNQPTGDCTSPLPTQTSPVPKQPSPEPGITLPSPSELSPVPPEPSSLSRQPSPLPPAQPSPLLAQPSTSPSPVPPQRTASPAQIQPMLVPPQTSPPPRQPSPLSSQPPPALVDPSPSPTPTQPSAPMVHFSSVIVQPAAVQPTLQPASLPRATTPTIILTPEVALVVTSAPVPVIRVPLHTTRHPPSPRHKTTVTHSPSVLQPRGSSSRKVVSSHQRSQFCKQTESPKRSAPAYSFTKSTPEGDRKLYLNADLQSTCLARDSPGPGTYSLSPRSPTRRQQPLPALLSSSSPPDVSDTNRQRGNALPTLSARPVSPNFSSCIPIVSTFGNGEPRFAFQDRSMHEAMMVPGPGEYSVINPVKMLSQHPDLSPVRIGTGIRVDRVDGVHDRDFYGRESPGPCRYTPLPANMAVHIRHRFGAAQRPLGSVSTIEEKRAVMLPGPGAYCPDVKGPAIPGPQQMICSFGTQERECVNASSNKPFELNLSRHSHFTSRTDRSYPLPECKIPTPSSQQYSVDVDNCSKHPNNPNAVFAMTVRFPPIPSRVPGPGTYVV